MIKKVFLTVLTIILLLTLLLPTNIVQATSLSNITQGADNFLQQGQHGSQGTINGQILGDTSNLIYNTLLIIGVCVAVIWSTILGIKFITGSVEQKVKVKESLLPFVIGCVVIFGAFGIWRLIIVILR